MDNAVVLGTFDGVHLGHQSVISGTEGYNITALTFKNPPRTYLGSALKLLMTEQDRILALKNLGVNKTVMLEFDNVKDIPYEEFLDGIRLKYRPALIGCGYNYHFGKNAEGDTAALAKYCNKYNIKLAVAECVKLNGIPVSSTLIREEISKGNIKNANIMLGNKFGFSGVVINGDKRGRTIGFPTINQAFPKELTSPLFGVYETEVSIDCKKYRGITNIGIRPTFLTEDIFCETYIEGFAGNIYGTVVDLRFLNFIRKEQKFNSLSELKTAIADDVNSVFN